MQTSKSIQHLKVLENLAPKHRQPHTEQSYRMLKIEVRIIDLFIRVGYRVYRAKLRQQYIRV